MPNYTDKQVEAFISAREAELRKKCKDISDLRDCRQTAALEWAVHIGRIPREQAPENWKDPYDKLDKTTKPKKK